MNVLIVPSSLPSLPPCCVIIGRKAAGDLNLRLGSRPGLSGSLVLSPARRVSVTVCFALMMATTETWRLFSLMTHKGHNSRSRGGPRAVGLSKFYHLPSKSRSGNVFPYPQPQAGGQFQSLIRNRRL